MIVAAITGASVSLTNSTSLMPLSYLSAKEVRSVCIQSVAMLPWTLSLKTRTGLEAEVTPHIPLTFP